MDRGTNIENIREWLRNCPDIDSSKYFRIDYIDDDPKCYAIYSVPTAIKYKTDILGNTYPDTVQTINFEFCAICPWGKDIRQNVENVKAVTAIVEWMQEQNALHNLPIIHEGKAVSVLPALSPQPLQQTSETVIYQISIQIKYRRI